MTSIILSTLDKASSSQYLRYAFLFPTQDVATTKARLASVVQRTMTQLPVLAGSVVSRNGILMTLEQIKRFTAQERSHSTLDYHTLAKAGVPVSAIASADLTPLPDVPDVESSPVFAIQANYFRGGLLLVMYLHGLVADSQGIATIVREMSEGLGSRRLGTEDLLDEAEAASHDRAALSQSRGTPSFFAEAHTIRLRMEQQQYKQHTSASQQFQPGRLENSTNALTPSSPTSQPQVAVFGFKLKSIVAIKDAMNARRVLRSHDPVITEKDILIAILWRAFARAKYSISAAYHDWDQDKASVCFDVDVRSIMSLGDDYFGNASITATALEGINTLARRYDLPEMEMTANIVHEAMSRAASARIVRSRIKLLNEQINAVNEPPTADLIIKDWSRSQPELPGAECDLGLQLGTPVCIRKTGRVLGSKELIILPKNEASMSWEVQVELEGNLLKSVLEDVALLEHIWSVAHGEI